MGYARFSEERPSEQQPQQEVEVNGKGLARIYGYMGIALAITALIAVLVSWFFSSHINSAASIQVADGWVVGYFATLGVSLIACLILTFVIPVTMIKNKRSLWVPYILYAVFMGALLSVVLIAGISWAIIGEAFGLTAGAFLIMFFIGYFSKKDISLGLYFLIGLLSMALLVVLFWFIFASFSGGWQAIRTVDIVYSVIVCVIMLLFIVIDGIRVKQIASRGAASNNVYLYCAYMMYSDFITLLIRVIWLLARAKND
ncbi:MAG: US12 family protein [Bacilli bacterium]|nr:US12 family protein [Bacilli bacterium]